MANRTDTNRMRELGRAGGKASAEARRKRRTRPFLDVLRGKIEADPERFAESLLSSPPGAVKAAALLEKSGSLVPVPAEPEAKPAPEGTSLSEIVAFVYANGNAAIFGLPTSVAEFEALLAGTGDAGARERGTPVPSSPPLTNPVPARDLQSSPAAEHETPEAADQVTHRDLLGGGLPDSESLGNRSTWPTTRQDELEAYCPELHPGRVAAERRALGLDP
jgi:hypothetical protein